MAKTIKIIDLLNKIANGEIENNTKFKIIPEDGERFICKYASGYPGYIWVIDEGNEVSFNYKIDHMRILGYEVEIIEEQQDIDIQEMTGLDEFDIQGLEVSGYSMTQAEYLLEDGIAENRELINKILQWAKQLDKNIKDKE